jgi:hypothetical protein
MKALILGALALAAIAGTVSVFISRADAGATITYPNGRSLNGVIIMNGRELGGTGVTLSGIRAANGRLGR